MPRTIRVLWIEDKPSKTIEKLTSIVEKEVKLRSYKFELYNALEVATAVDIMKNNYIDIIFSDFNLSKGKNGLEYLNELRDEKNFKYYVLYSNNKPGVIIKEVIEKIEDKKRMDLFSNFNFFSLESSPRDELYEILNHYLDERSKIEEIRNIYIVANSIMEDKITILFPEHHDKDYSVKIDIFCERFGIDSEIKDTWQKIRTNRNIFAHGEQEYIDNKWIVTLDSGRRITLDKEKYIECLEDMAKIEEEIAIKCPDFNKKKFE